jgi:hypothetical protein
MASFHGEKGRGGEMRSHGLEERKPWLFDAALL